MQAQEHSPRGFAIDPIFTFTFTRKDTARQMGLVRYKADDPYYSTHHFV